MDHVVDQAVAWKLEIPAVVVLVVVRQEKHVVTMELFVVGQGLPAVVLLVVGQGIFAVKMYVVSQD